MKLPFRVLLLGAVAGPLASLALYVSQGGFGGGHGRFDLAIFLLGLPWDYLISLLPWRILFKRDYEWLIVLPLLLNLCTILFAAMISRRQR